MNIVLWEYHQKFYMNFIQLVGILLVILLFSQYWCWRSMSMEHFSILSIFLNLFLLFLKISLYKFFTSLMSWTSKNFFLESCYESNVLLIYFSVFIILAYRKVSVAIFWMILKLIIVILYLLAFGVFLKDQ